MAEQLDAVPARAMAVYAHPDDPEVACGATLALWAARGCEVTVVIGAAGDKGSDDPTVVPDELAERRAGEVAAAAEALGVTRVELLGHPDGSLATEPGLRASLVGLVRDARPEVVICPDPTAVFFGDGYVNHADHRAIGWAALDAVAPAASSPLYFPELGPVHQVSVMLLTGTLEADVWVEVGEGLDAKVAALFCHRSQLADDADEWLAAFVRSRAEEEGRRIGGRFAESFRRIRLVR